MPGLLNLSDDTHLGLKESPSTNSASSVAAWKTSLRKATVLIVAFLGDSAIAKTGNIIDDEHASAYTLCTTISELLARSNIQAEQNLHNKLEDRAETSTFRNYRRSSGS